MNNDDSLINLMKFSEITTSFKFPIEFHTDLWQEGPLNRWAFQHVSTFLKTQEICAKDKNQSLYSNTDDNIPQNIKTFDSKINLLENIDINVEGHLFKFINILEETYTDSILVLHKGNIIYEKYFNNMKENSNHLLQSISKSLLGILYAKMIDKGIIDPKQSIGHYLPELEKCAFGSATIAQALDMKVALNFSEDYTALDSEMSRLDRACGWKTNSTGTYTNLRSFLSSLTRRVSNDTQMQIEHGTEFQYCSATTDVLAWLISHVTGVSYAKLLEKELWIPIGAQQNANITVDSEGLAVGNGGISCTTRDMALFGQLILNGGKAFNGTQIIPSSWIEQTYNGNQYKNHWWVNPNPKQHGSNEIHARGIYGQYMWIDQDTNTVIAKFSSNPTAKNSPKFGLHMALFRAISIWTQNKDYT